MNFLIDPSDVINYQRSDDELELFWLFCLTVAGKTATTQARLLSKMLEGLEGEGPFDRIRLAAVNGVLLQTVIDSRLGQYNRLHRAFLESTTLDLRTANVDTLETIFGVGPKTARMFLMMSRENQRYAALDTHVLKHLRANDIPAPKTTPSGALYRRLEEAFLRLADKAEMPVSEYDLMVWKMYSRKEHANTN